ncbi:MAG TPA: tetratricopeptide repeat protein [Candidatus Polarisedimenticolaceae bacterium]|nr:tetratricopeptide repeat protein [Candidatus Polarisedimenticolaceae bacterium]
MIARRLLLALVLAVSSARAQNPEAAFERACQAYAQGKWDEAADGFRELLRYGFNDPRLEYNLANAEYKRGRLGEAILHYERARRLAPSDPDVLGNLALARSRIRDVIEDPDSGGALTAWRAWQDRIGPGAQAIAALAGLWVVAGIVTWCASRRGGFTPAWGWALSAAVLATIVVALSWQATWTRLSGTRRAVVLHPTAEALAGPGLNNTSQFTLHEGTTVEVRGDRPGWLQVALPNGATGWIPDDAAERI